MENIFTSKKNVKLETSFSNVVTLIILVFVISLQRSSAQVAFGCNDLTQNGLFHHNTWTFNFHNYCTTIGNLNWSVSNPSTPFFFALSNATVNITADKEITIGPDFTAGDFDEGSFEAKINEAPVDAVILVPNSTQVPKYEKLEIGMVLSDEINETVQNYFNNSGTIKNNPFDPDNINVEAIFLSPTGRVNRVNGFYYKEFAPNFEFNAWNEIPTPYHWRLRFSPDEVGTWSLSITVNANGCEPLNSAGLIFYCDENTNEKGYLEVSSNNHRYLRYKDSHESFFGIGQNIAWPDATSPGDDARCIPSDYNTFLGYVHNLGNNQGNLTRIVLNTRWSYGIEFERLGDYRDDEQNAPSWELDRYFEALEPYNLKTIVCMQLQEQFRTVPLTEWSALKTYWPNNPYNVASEKNTIIPGIYNVPDFITNESAKVQFRKYLRYLIARWGYSTNIAYWQVVSEIDNWDGYIDNQNSYDDWQTEMAIYMKTIDQKHIVSSSYTGNQNINDYNYVNEKFSNPFLEIGGHHPYGNEKTKNLNSRYIIVNGSGDHGEKKGFYDYCAFKKPFLFDEIGEWGSSRNRTPCNLIEMHNTFWATGFMGGLGVGLEWWEWGNNEVRSQIFPRLRNYFDGIDFENNTFEPQRFPKKGVKPEDDDDNNKRLESFTLVNEQKTKAYGWMHNRSYYWGNLLHENNKCEYLDQFYPEIFINNLCQFPCPDDDFNCGCDAISSMDGEISVRGLKIKKDYNVKLTNTWVIAPEIEFERQSNLLGELKIQFNTDDITPDWAYKIKRTNESDYRNLSQQDNISYDTLSCPLDSIITDGYHDADSSGNMNYFWDFGNGYTSNQRVNTVFYDTAGTYLVKLIVTDSLGFSDTLKQYFVIPSCIETIQAKLSPTQNQSTTDTIIANNRNISNGPKVEIFPNPFVNYIQINCNINEFKTFYVFDISGRQITTFNITNSSQIIELTHLAKGVFFIQLKGNSKEFNYKLIKL